MNYIVLDLEWNQPEQAVENIDDRILFEIIEIGAVKINEGGQKAGSFSELIRPQVYHSMNSVTGQLLCLKMEELNAGRSFCEVMNCFLDWCGKEENVFCTWGPADLTVLQKNMAYYGMEPLCAGPLKYFDLQKIFGYIYEEDVRQKRTLEYAVDYLAIEKNIPFHRAFDDACYTAEILLKMLRDGREKFAYFSYDVSHPPICKKDEVKVQFDTYTKYISRVFSDKAEAMRDREVISSRCYLCHCNLKKKVKWFTVNHRHYYCLAYCEKHGYLKGKIRMIKGEGDQVFVVKTTKLIPEEEALRIIKKREKAIELHRKHKRKTL